MRSCDKAGCEREGAWLVTLDAADGTDEWRACREHALAFEWWVKNETNRQGKHWCSIRVEEIVL